MLKCRLLLLQVNFAYKEAGERKQALVKLRLCPKHALQLNHKQNQQQLVKKRKREHSSRDEPARAAASNPDQQDCSQPQSGIASRDKQGEESAADRLLDELFV